MSPPIFGDFFKTVDDIIDDDFGDKKYLKVTTSAPSKVCHLGGVKLTTENGLPNFDGKVTAKGWKHDSGFSLDKLTFNKNSADYEASMSKLANGLTVKGKGSLFQDKNKNWNPLKSLSFEFTDDCMAAVCDTDTGFEKPSASVVLGHDGLQVGGELKLKNNSLDDYGLAIGYDTKNLFVSVSAKDKLNKFGVAGTYLVSDDLTLALRGTSVLEFTKGSANRMEAAAAYKLNDKTTAKCKYSFVDGEDKNDAGSVQAAINTKPAKSVSLAGSLKIPLGNPQYKYGFGITLG